MILSVIASACPLILCSIGALFSEYAGVLALFIEGIISLSAFLIFTFTVFTGMPVLSVILSCIICVFIVFLLGLIIQKVRGHVFIAAISMNLMFSSLVSFLSFLIFGNRGVLTSPQFVFNVQQVQLVTVVISVLLIATGIVFLICSKLGLYIRITGSDADVLRAKGVNPSFCRILSWCISALYACVAGGFLVFRLSSFVPNISSGRGWMALAAVFLGNKKADRILITVAIFCLADVFAVNVQNILPVIPSSVVLSLPYIVALLLIAVQKND